MLELEKCPICKMSQFTQYMESKDFSVSKEVFCMVKCSNCNLVFTNPRPTDNGIAKYYASDHYISHTNSKKNLFEKTYQTIRSIAIKNKFKLISSYFTKGNVLDIGCGTGNFLNFCKEKKWGTRGVEPNDMARNKAISNYRLTIDSSIDLNKITERFNVITMWHVLEHVTDLNKTLVNLNHLIKENGKIIVAVPNLNSYDSSFYKNYWAAYDLPIHLYHFTKDSITSLFKSHNFKLIKTKGMPFDSFYVSLLSEKYKTGRKNLIRSFLIGCISNLAGIFTNRGFSSTIYVFEKNNL